MNTATQERNSIQRAFGRTVTIARLPWNIFIGAFLVTFLCCQYGSWLYGPFVGIGLWTATFTLLKFDPHPVRAFWLWLRYGRHAYDSGNRFFFAGRQHDLASRLL